MPSWFVLVAGNMSRMSSTSKSILKEKNPVSVLVGLSLKKRRISADMSQEDLAFAAEVDRTMVSRIERGIANPSIITLGTLCFALKTTLADFFSEVDIALSPSEAEGRRVNAAQPKAPVRMRRLR